MKESFLTKSMIDAIIKEAKEDCCEIYFPEIVDTPTGTKQTSNIEMFDHEYVDQKCGCCGDDYYGSIYYPLPCGKYIRVRFSM